MKMIKKLWLSLMFLVANWTVALGQGQGWMMGGMADRTYGQYIDQSEKPLYIIGNIVQFVLTMMGFIAVCVIIRWWIKMIVSGGSDDGAAAKKIVIYAVAGLCIVIIAYTLVAWVTGATSFLGEATDTTWTG